MERSNGYRLTLILVGFVVVGSLVAFSGNLWARPTTAREAGDLVYGWLKTNPKPLGTSLGQRVKDVETFVNENGEPIYYIAYLQPSGFVIVSADDLVEPIICFGQDSTFDPSPENPLGALVTEDLNSRIASVRSTIKLQNVHNQSEISENQRRWKHFIDLAKNPGNNVISLMGVGVNSISDVLVAPLVKSKWGQETISEWSGGTVGEYCPLPCYNYYTPNNFPCGCPATALAQLMRYHEYPMTGIGMQEFTIRVSGAAQTVSTHGGDGSGGPYNWDLMPYEPNCDSTETQRQAIGALCYDAGISMSQNYNSSGSGWIGCTEAPIKQAITTTFTYGNAVHGYSGGRSHIGKGLRGMINPNLDAKKPVLLSTYPHAFICDGYGYIASTLYHHLNMGVLGIDDLWYELGTNLVSPLDGFDYGPVCSCVYNVQTIKSGDGEIISGRVIDHNAEPIANAVLYVTSMDDLIAETETDDNGIYAFDCLESNTTYTVNAALRGYGFSRQIVTTGISQDNSVVSGNLWGVDLVGLLCDFNSDQKVDIEDMVMLIDQWGQNNPSFDIAPTPLGDGIVDVQDLEVLLAFRDIEVDIPVFGLVAHWQLDETEGDIAYDSIDDNHGILSGNPTWQSENGQVAGALEFDGIDDYITTDFVLNPADGPFSAFVWIQGGAPGRVIISQADVIGTGETWLGLYAQNGNLMTGLVPPPLGRFKPEPLVSQATITDDEWYHVGIVYDGSYRFLYVDGVEIAKDTRALAQALMSSDGGLYICADKDLDATSFFTGLIDDVRIYDVALTAEEIAALAQ